jgi:hypothetical protein
MSFVSDEMDKARAAAKRAAATPPSTPTIDGEIGLVDLRNKLRNPTSAEPLPPTTPPPTSTKCGVICQKKKKRKVLLIGFGVLLVGGVSYFILKKK